MGLGDGLNGTVNGTVSPITGGLNPQPSAPAKKKGRADDYAQGQGQQGAGSIQTQASPVSDGSDHANFVQGIANGTKSSF